MPPLQSPARSKRSLYLHKQYQRTRRVRDNHSSLCATFKRNVFLIFWCSLSREKNIAWADVPYDPTLTRTYTTRCSRCNGKEAVFLQVLKLFFSLLHWKFELRLKISHLYRFFTKIESLFITFVQSLVVEIDGRTINTIWNKILLEIEVV